MQPVKADQKITTRAGQISRAGAGRRRRLGHGRGLRFESLVAIDPQEASALSPSGHTRESVTPTSGTKSHIRRATHVTTREVARAAQVLFETVGAGRSCVSEIQGLRDALVAEAENLNETADLLSQRGESADLLAREVWVARGSAGAAWAESRRWDELLKVLAQSPQGRPLI